MSRELYDGDGYPTDAALERLEHFEGTPLEMAEYVKSLMKMGGAKIEDFTDQWDRPRKRLTLVTMGWSGCETVIGVLHKTLFHFAYWESSHRGGLYTYEIPMLTWDAHGKWGDPAADLDAREAPGAGSGGAVSVDGMHSASYIQPRVVQPAGTEPQPPGRGEPRVGHVIRKGTPVPPIVRECDRVYVYGNGVSGAVDHLIIHDAPRDSWEDEWLACCPLTRIAPNATVYYVERSYQP